MGERMEFYRRWRPLRAEQIRRRVWEALMICEWSSVRGSVTHGGSKVEPQIISSHIIERSPGLYCFERIGHASAAGPRNELSGTTLA